MKSRRVLWLMLVAGCATSPSAELPATTEPFEPGLFSSPGSTYRGTFTPDDREFYFFRKVGPENSEDYRIFVSRRDANGWSQPARVDLGGEFSDLYPVITNNGRRLIFSSYRPAPGDTSARPSSYIWYADRAANGWSAPLLAPVSMFGHYHSQISVTDAGALQFKRQTADYRNPVELSGTLERADTTAAWRYWKPRLRSDLFLWETTPGHDDSYALLVVSPRDTATGRPTGKSDLWVSFRNGERWSDPRPLGAGVNSADTENFAFYSGDRRMLYFVREFREFRRVSLRAALGERPRSF